MYIYIYIFWTLIAKQLRIYLLTYDTSAWFNHQHIWIKLKLYPINITSSTLLKPPPVNPKLVSREQQQQQRVVDSFSFSTCAPFSLLSLSLSLFPLTFHDPITSETACILQIAGTRASFSSRIATHMRGWKS